MTSPAAFLRSLLLLTTLILSLQAAAVERARAQGLSFPAQINKSFAPISIPAGGTSVLSVTVYNPNSFPLTLSTTPPAWSDDLAAADLQFSASPNAVNDCGGIVSISGSTFSLIGGTVPAQVGTTPGSCTVTVNVTSTVAGNHVNTIPANALLSSDPTGTIAITNTTPASATLQVNSVQPPSLSKSFAPNTIWVGQTSILTITVRNTDPSASLTQVSLTDNLPASILIASPPLPSPSLTSCGGSAFLTGASGSSLASGDTSVTLNNGTIAAGATCTIRVNVTSSTPGIYTNTIPASAIRTQQGVTNSSPASAPLNVQAIGVRKAFSPTAFLAGGASTLTITLQNPSSNPYTGVAISDNLPAGLSVASPPAASQCSGTVTSTATSVSLSGGTIPAGTISSPGTCTIVVSVTSSTPATYTNTIPAGSLTTAEGASNILAATANITVYGTGPGGGGLGVSGNKNFNPSSIAVGGTSRLTINITAPADSALTSFSVSDALPGGVQVSATPNPTKNANCSGGTFAPVAGDTLLLYSGGTISPGVTCTLAVNVTSSVTGVFTNTISPANISNAENRTMASNITANLTVSGLSVSKAFAPNTVHPNGISTLTITLTNTNPNQLDNVSLTDNLPGTTTNGVAIAPVPNASTTCGGGTLTANAGTQLISLTGGVIPAQVGSVPGICTILVDVIGRGVAATYTNTIPAGNVSGTIHGTATVVSNPSAANSTLRVLSITIGVVKGFNPLTVFGGSASTLTIQLSNPNTVALAGIAFTDNLPQGVDGGMTVASPANASVGTCGGAISATPGATSFSFSGGSLAASASCSMTLSVTMNVNANLTNTIPAGGVTTSNGATNPQAASATLTNLPGASVSKIFAPNPVQAGMGNSSTLTITIQNTSNFQLDGMGMTDTLPAGMTVASPPAGTQCGGTITSTSDSVTLEDGVLAGSSSCDVVVSVTAPAAGSYLNCIPANELTNNQGATNINPACDTLTVITPPTIGKAFAPTSIAAGATSALTFTLRNPAANTVPLSGVSFTDTFPPGMTLASVPNAAQCSGTVTSTANSVTLSGGTIPVNSICTVTVSVTAASGGVYLNISDAVTSTNGGTGDSASATLTVIDPPAISKSFSPGSINTGEISTLTFTLSNPNASITLTGVAFTDGFPAGMQAAAPPNASLTGCNASSTPVFAPAAGDTGLAFSSGSITGAGTCTISIDVTAAGGSHVNTSSAVTSTNGGTGNTASDTLDVAGGGLLLEKSTTAAGYRAAGDTIEYTYLLTNTGTVTLFPPYAVSDDKTPVSCPGVPASLDPLDTVTCTAAYTVQAADVAARSITNTATGTAQEDDGDTVTSNADSLTVRLASLNLIKSTTTAGYRTAGNTITYNYTLTNTGSLTLYAPFTITDDRLGTPLGTPFTCGSAASLAPGGNITCTTTYTVTAADVSAGSVTNTARASALDAPSGEIVTSNEGSVTVYAVIAPVIAKSFSPATIPAGTTSLLSFTITNPAANVVALTGVGLIDNLPSGVTVAIDPTSAQCGGTVTSTSTSISLSGGTVLPNSSCTVSVTVIGATHGLKNNTSNAVTSTNGGSGNTASATLSVVAPPSISKSFSPSSVVEGGTSTLTFTLTAPAGNPEPLTGVAFSDVLPTGLQVAAAPNVMTNNCGTPSFAPAPGDTVLHFNSGTIAAGTACTLSVDVTAVDAGTFDNTTNAVTSTNGGTGATSNTATLTAEEALDLSITKTDGRQAVDPGEALTYTIVVSNAGPSDALDASVFDTIPSSLTGASWTCAAGPGAACTASGSGNISDTVDIPAGASITYTVNAVVSNAAATNIVNAAAVLPPPGIADTNNANNSAIDIDSLNRLVIAKSASPLTYSLVGEMVSYSYTITNNGTSTLSAPFTVDDDKVTPTCSAPVTLAPTESFTCTATHAITQTDLDAGSVTNIVTASGRDADDDTVTSASDSETVNASQSPSLSLVKSITAGDPYTTAGDAIEYSYTLRNTGNVTLSGPFTVSDDKVTVTCPAAASLAPDATLLCTASHNVTQPDLDAGSITNNASASASSDGTPVTSNTDSQTANATQTTGLELEKSIVSGDPYSVAGDVIHYEYLLTNSGNVTLTGAGAGGRFTVTDDNATVTCPAAPTSLGPGDTVTCTASYTVTASDLGGSVTNQAQGNALFGTTPVDSISDSQTAYGSPVLSITKDDGLEIVAPGTVLDYTIVISNNSLQDAAGLQLVDTIPDGTTFVSASDGGTYDSGTEQVSWPSFDLAAGASVQYSLRLQVEDAARLQADTITSITNEVQVQDDGTHSGGVPVQADASDTDQIAAIGVKNLTGTGQAGSATPDVLIGEILSYSIHIDIPTGTLANLQAVDIPDHGLAFVGCEPVSPIEAGSLVLERNPCVDAGALTVQAEPATDTDPSSENAGRRVTFDFGQVQNASGSTQTLTLNYRAIVLNIPGIVDGVDDLDNRVQWTWTGGTLTGSAQGVEIIEPALAITKEVNPAIGVLGSTVTFTIEVEHAPESSAPAYDVIVTDSLPASLVLDPASVQVTGSVDLPAAVVTASSSLLTVTWSEFPLGADARITFEARFVGPSPVVNTASVEWSSLQIDPAPRLQPQSPYNRYSTERRYDPLDSTRNGYRVEASASLSVPLPPETGFAADQITNLPHQPQDKAYQSMGELLLEIPRLGVKVAIVGVPLGRDQEWDLTWLGGQAGYLNSTAYPTRAGNSVLTGHLYLPSGLPGPFVHLGQLRFGDTIIVHLAGQRYLYEVRENRLLSARDTSIFGHKDHPWLTLVTCRDYDERTGTYLRRVAVAAVLVNVE